MFRDEFRHLEHADLTLAIEDGLERVVSINHGPLFLILASVLLDVVPKLLRELGTRQRFRTNDRRKLVVGLDRSHKGRIWFTL